MVFSGKSRYLLISFLLSISVIQAMDDTSGPTPADIEYKAIMMFMNDLQKNDSLDHASKRFLFGQRINGSKPDTRFRLVTESALYNKSQLLEFILEHGGAHDLMVMAANEIDHNKESLTYLNYRLLYTICPPATKHILARVFHLFHRSTQVSLQAARSGNVLELQANLPYFDKAFLDCPTTPLIEACTAQQPATVRTILQYLDERYKYFIGEILEDKDQNNNSAYAIAVKSATSKTGNREILDLLHKYLLPQLLDHESLYNNFRNQRAQLLFTLLMFSPEECEKALSLFPDHDTALKDLNIMSNGIAQEFSSPSDDSNEKMEGVE